MNATEPTPMPSAIEAEQAILGQMLTAPSVIDDVEGALSAADFYRPDHGRLFTLLTSARSRGQGTDIVSILPMIDDDRKGVLFGGLSYVVSLPDKAPSTANASHYVGQIRDAAQRRRGIAVLREAVTALHDRHVPAAETVAATMDRIGDVSGALGAFDVTAQIDAVDEAERLIREDEQAPGPRWPLRAFDEMIPGGIRPALYVLGARPAVGKTALAMQIVRGAAEAGHGGLVCCQEMDAPELAEREVAAGGLLSYSRITARNIGDGREWHETRDGLDLPVWYDCRSSLTPGMVRQAAMIAARKARARGTRLRVVVVDYLQMMDHQTQRGELATQAIGRTMYALKRLSKDLGAAVIVLSQLNRGQDDNEEPTLAALLDSGKIEAAAQVVMFLWRHDAEDHASRTITVSKIRNGKPGRAVIAFDGQRQTFHDPREWRL